MGLEAPQGVELVNKLFSMGFDVDKDVLSDKECTDAILSFIRGNQ